MSNVFFSHSGCILLELFRKNVNWTISGTTSFNYLKWNFLDLKLSKDLKHCLVTIGAMKLTLLVKCLKYRVYKQEHKIESYLVKLSPSLCNFYNRFRCMNHRLPMEFDRFFNIERSKRKCRLYKTG